MALMNSHSKGGYGTVNGIIRMNRYGVHSLTDGQFDPNTPNPFCYIAVFDVGSRINHRSVCFFICFLGGN